MTDFVGRSEDLVQDIICRLYRYTESWTQVPIVDIINKEDSEIYGEEFSKHKCDIVLNVANVDDGKSFQSLVVEVNYKHKDKAGRKWNNNFGPDIVKSGKIPVRIDDFNCRSSIKKENGRFELGLFHQNENGEHIRSWNDYRDVIDALEKAGVKP
ncbi:MAG: hypothetical protein K5785_00825 [Nitrosarchaeum sp.]|nr:hypothetical protein [Nitrosarchaeum sp.]